MGLADFFKHPLSAKLASVFGATKNRDELLADIEELLVASDVAVDISAQIVKQLAKQVHAATTKEEILAVLQQELLALFQAFPASKPLPVGKHIVLLVGVNGCGKTTTAAKLAHYYKKQGLFPLLAAADTFRAAGSSQLSLWGERIGIPVIGGDKGADPGSVVYNSLQSFQNKNFDRLVIDTAGRVQTKEHLMRELEKINKIIKKFYPAEPCETFLVLDATTGQNALAQAETFRVFSDVTGIILTKLDGSAKGGTVITIAASLKLGVRFIGHGESADDLLAFTPGEFIHALVYQ